MLETVEKHLEAVVVVALGLCCAIRRWRGFVYRHHPNGDAVQLQTPAGVFHVPGAVVFGVAHRLEKITGKVKRIGRPLRRRNCRHEWKVEASSLNNLARLIYGLSGLRDIRVGIEVAFECLIGVEGCESATTSRIVAQERFRNSSGKIEEDLENDAHKIYEGLNGGNDFKHREAYKILARESRWANLRVDGLNHAGNIPRNIARRTSDNSSLGNSSD
ncbi:hypothetical protein GIB67_011909 [Kingdonia uniflora]|uniref:Uncharacterized protein n=1 Tax=Kingdonia uniflora TaxID=39325 RepID=A0A7J7M006_9MAGN|nr:hypothetical protein GIB67_011909 [Kingdonia uniflora]